MNKRKVSEIVSARFETRRQSAEETAARRKAELHRALPELEALDRERAGAAAELLGTVFQGKEGLEARVEAVRERQRKLKERRTRILLQNGYPADYDQPHRLCPVCQDSGFVDGKMCACMRREIVLEGYKNSGMGRLLERQRFDNFDLSRYDTRPLPGKSESPREAMQSVFEDCRAWAEHFDLTSPSLLLIGGTGLGKTHLSSAMAATVIDKGYDVLYVSVPVVLSRAEKDRFVREEEGEESVVTRMQEADLLILDDLGAEPSSKLASSLVYTLVNERATMRGLPTIISTNLDPAHLERNYDTAVTSRLLGDFTVMHFIGSDLRLNR